MKIFSFSTHPVNVNVRGSLFIKTLAMKHIKLVDGLKGVVKSEAPNRDKFYKITEAVLKEVPRMVLEINNSTTALSIHFNF